MTKAQAMAGLQALETATHAAELEALAQVGELFNSLREHLAGMTRLIELSVLETEEGDNGTYTENPA